MNSPSRHFPTSPSAKAPPVRVLIIPGLRDSGPGHWQTWLQDQYADAARVKQHDWANADLDAWSAQIDATLARYAAHTQWIAVAHSFGCLALAHHLARRGPTRTDAGDAEHRGGIHAALMVAPADPVKFNLTERLPKARLGLPSLLIGSENDPWMPLARAQHWARTWGAAFHNLGQVGHINTESGFGPWPSARLTVDRLVRLQRARNSSEDAQGASERGTLPWRERLPLPGLHPAIQALGSQAMPQR